MDIISKRNIVAVVGMAALWTLAPTRLGADCVCPDASLTLEGPSVVCLGQSIGPTNIIKYCGSEQKYPGRNSDGSCKPCVECAGGCDVDLDIPEVTGPGSYTVVGVLVSGCGSASDSYGVTVNPLSGAWSDHTFGGVVEVPPGLLGKIERGIQKIPGCGGVTISAATAEAHGKARDCCLNGVPQVKGDRYKEATATLSAELKGITVWGPPTISEVFDFGFLVIDVDLEVGVKLNSDFSVNGTVGFRENDCMPESCPYGSFGVSFDGELAATVDVIACAETYWTEKKCADLTVTPASITASLNGDVRYNSNEACDGLHGEIELDAIKFRAEFKVAGKGLYYEYDIYP